MGLKINQTIERINTISVALSMLIWESKDLERVVFFCLQRIKHESYI